MTIMKIWCTRGGVAYEAIGAPIASAVCCCASCQEAGHTFEQLPAAPRLLEPDGGTAVVLSRKDRVRHVRGREYLKAYRLKPGSPTRRLATACRNAPMFLDVTKGHWLSMYRCRFMEGAPEIEMRVMTRDRRASESLPGDIPEYRGYSGRFVVRLYGGVGCDGSRTPKVNVGGDSIDSGPIQPYCLGDARHKGGV